MIPTSVRVLSHALNQLGFSFPRGELVWRRYVAIRTPFGITVAVGKEWQ